MMWIFSAFAGCAVVGSRAYGTFIILSLSNFSWRAGLETGLQSVRHPVTSFIAPAGTHSVEDFGCLPIHCRPPAADCFTLQYLRQIHVTSALACPSTPTPASLDSAETAECQEL